ncbi:MAG: serine protease [Alphaproteobacteria bacterium]|nr:MAG: serine protease [Alphaproteobacteria bacterium]
MPNHVSPFVLNNVCKSVVVRRSIDIVHLVRYALMTAFVALSVVLGGQSAASAERPDSFADLAEKLSPAVVNISTTMVVNGNNRPQMPQFPEGSPFEDFFKEFQDRGEPSRRAQSLGSGFIIDAAGIVVTNNHVIENADEISVILANDESFKAKVIGRDAKTDIAVLQIDPGDSKLTAVSFGNSDGLRVGDWVMAIGNPFGLGGTVTAGIVSARGRDIGSGPYDDFIQTDASINRGNSGGPLFNLDGEVIGINTAIFSQTGGSVGIGFAISANLATQVVGQLQDYGRTRRGWLGVFIQEVTEDIADSLGLDSAKGALIASVTEAGPADEAGLQAGDVITRFNGKDVVKSRDLPRIVAETPVETTVDVEVVRGGERKTLSVTLGELEQAENGGLLSRSQSKEKTNDTRIENIGLTVAPLTEELAEKFDLDTGETGIVVVDVKDGSPAADKGVQPGDIIRRLNQSAITSVDKLIEGIASAKKEGRKGVLMLIESDGQTRFVQISFDE